MDRTTEEAELLRQVLEAQRRDVRSGRITAIAVLVLAAALVISLAVLAPALLRTMNEAHATMVSTQELIRRANSSLDALDSMTGNVDALIRDGGENLSRVTEVLDSIDLEALADSIQKLNAVIETLSGFRLFG